MQLCAPPIPRLRLDARTWMPWDRKEKEHLICPSFLLFFLFPVACWLFVVRCLFFVACCWCFWCSCYKLWNFMLKCTLKVSTILIYIIYSYLTPDSMIIICIVEMQHHCLEVLDQGVFWSSGFQKSRLSAGERRLTSYHKLSYHLGRGKGHRGSCNSCRCLRSRRRGE